ncbi:N-6 DNA methylase [Parasphingorhabdus sp. NYA22]
MDFPLVRSIIERCRSSGMSLSDAVIWASACAARIKVSDEPIPDRNGDMRAIFRPLELLLTSDRQAHDALDYAIGWIFEQRISQAKYDGIWECCRQLFDENRYSKISFQDYAAELLQIAASDSRSSIFGLMPAPQSAILSDLKYSSDDKIACFFPSAAPIALALSKEHDVTLFAGEGETALVMTMLSISNGNRLNVDRRDPVSGNYGFNSHISDRSSPIDSTFDHIFSIPPFGVKLRFENRDQRTLISTIDQYQFERFSKNFTKSFISIVPEGLLFRTSNSDIEFKRCMFEDGLAGVTSLPAGIFGQRTGILTSLVALEKPAPLKVRFTDSRTIDDKSRSRPTSSDLAKHFELAQNSWINQPDRSVLVEREELENNEFNLSVDRYVNSGRLKQLSEAISDQQRVRLGDIAEIIRPYAAKPARDEDATNTFTAREITTGDVVDNIVRCPSRHTQYFNSDREKVDRAKVERGDIIISMKGKIGVVGLVDGFDAFFDQMLLDEPWVISQSFAIIRLGANSPFMQPGILATLLSAPWAVEKFHALAGGSTIQMIGMKDLKAFEVVIPDFSAINHSMEKLQKMDDRRKAIMELQGQNAIDKRELWSQLWNVYLDEGNSEDA